MSQVIMFLNIFVSVNEEKICGRIASNERYSGMNRPLSFNV